MAAVDGRYSFDPLQPWLVRRLDVDINSRAVEDRGR